MDVNSTVTHILPRSSLPHVISHSLCHIICIIFRGVMAPEKA